MLGRCPTQVGLEPPLLQILVVVANNQERTSLTEVEKGSMSTSVEHGLVSPKPKDKIPVSNVFRMSKI